MKKVQIVVTAEGAPNILSLFERMGVELGSMVSLEIRATLEVEQLTTTRAAIESLKAIPTVRVKVEKVESIEPEE